MTLVSPACHRADRSPCIDRAPPGLRRGQAALRRLCVVLRALGLVALATSLTAHAMAQAPDTEALPPSEMILDIDSSTGRPVATGRLPGGLATSRLRQLLPGLDTSGLETGGTGDADAWEGAIEALNVVLPRIESTRIRMTPGNFRATGRLLPGFSLSATQPALRAALGPNWTLDFSLTEEPPEAGIDFALTEDGRLSLGGILPEGMSVNQALLTMGGAHAVGLTDGGQGDPAAWARDLSALHGLLRGFTTAEGMLDAGELEIEGRLAPGLDAETLAAWTGAALSSPRAIAIVATETAPREGDRRHDPVSGLTARYVDGEWRPEFGFAPEPPGCATAAATVLTEGRIAFVEGSAELDAIAGATIDAIAELARHCLGGGLTMDIGGHTDDIGQPAHNLALSQARAEAVREALVARGLPPVRITADGYGDTRPVADNATEAGRAHNRRITIDWREAGIPRPPLPARNRPAPAAPADEDAVSRRPEPEEDMQGDETAFAAAVPVADGSGADEPASGAGNSGPASEAGPGHAPQPPGAPAVRDVRTGHSADASGPAPDGGPWPDVGPTDAPLPLRAPIADASPPVAPLPRTGPTARTGPWAAPLPRGARSSRTGRGD